MRIAAAFPAVLAAMAACTGLTDPGALLNVRGDGTTGLAGTVRRGPVTPVCLVDVPCDAPVHGGFQVLLGQLVVAHFESDTAGHYRVLLAPGAYGIRADTAAPIWPLDQTLEVTVGGSGMTSADLEFDTGIR